MKKLAMMFVTAAMAALLVTGCTWNRQDTGTLAGGVVGGAAGYAVTGGSALGTGVGAVGGAIVGNQLSR